MKDLTPQAWIPGITIIDETITIPVTSLGGIPPDSLYDIRGVIIGILHAIKSHQDQLAIKNRVDEIRIMSTSSGATTTFQVRVTATPSAFSFAKPPKPTPEPTPDPIPPTDG